MRLTIKVTSDDIANGVRGDGAACPITLAVRREIEADAYVSTGISHVWIDEGGGVKYRARHSPEVWAWLDAFDAGYEVDPTEFELEFVRHIDEG